MLVCLLRRLFVRVVNLLDGMVGSSCWRHFPCSVDKKSVLIAALSVVLKDCIRAALLNRRMISVPHFFSDMGNCSTGLELPSVAFFASLSTDSLPAMLAWLGTQQMARWGRLCFFNAWSRESINVSVRERLDDE